MVSEQTTSVRPSSALYAWYVLFILFLVNAFNAIDRAMVNVLVEPIRKELGFSDGQIGLLSGIGFTLLYALLGVPLARLADRSNRRNILAAGLAIWSALTALTGQATGFFTFLLARAGVGIGEASCYPTAYPLIGDYFTKRRRPIAMAIFQAGVFAGIAFGSIITGWIAAAHGWRAAFAMIGLPGVALAVVVLLTVREPVRGASESGGARPAGKADMADVLRMLLRDRRFLLLILGTTCLTMASGTVSGWGAAFMMRLHGVSQRDVGLVSLPIGIGGMIGTIGGGAVGAWLAKRWAADRAPLAVPLAITLLSCPGMLLFIFAPSVPLALIGGAVGAFGIGCHTGPTLAVLIGLVQPDKRSMASALVVIGHLLIGFGLGPLVVGVLSDLLVPPLGTQSLRGALALCPLLVIVGWLLLRAAYKSIGATTQSASPP